MVLVMARDTGDGAVCNMYFMQNLSHMNMRVWKCTGLSMVLILDGNSGIGAQVSSNLCYLICLRHLLRSGVFKNRIFVFKRPIFVHPLVKHVLSYSMSKKS